MIKAINTQYGDVWRGTLNQWFYTISKKEWEHLHYRMNADGAVHKVTPDGEPRYPTLCFTDEGYMHSMLISDIDFVALWNAYSPRWASPHGEVPIWELTIEDSEEE